MVQQKKKWSALSKKVREEATRFHKDFLATIHPAITGVRPYASTALLVTYPSVSVFKELLCTYSYAHQSDESGSREEKRLADNKARTHAITAAVGMGLTIAATGLEDYMSRTTHEQVYVLEQPSSRAEISHQTQRELQWTRAHIPLLHFTPREETHNTIVSARVGDWYCEGTIDGHVMPEDPAKHLSSTFFLSTTIDPKALRTFNIKTCMDVFKDYKK